MIVPTLPALMLYSPTQHFPIFVNKSQQVVLNSMSKPLCVDRKLWRDRRTDIFETFFMAKNGVSIGCVPTPSLSPTLLHRSHSFDLCHHPQSYAKKDKSMYRAATE